MPTQNEYNVSIQRQRNQFVKINLLNFQFQMVDELSGVVIEYPSFTNDSSSDIRRTVNINMVVKDSSFDVNAGGRIWIDKYIQIFVGIESMRTREIEWTNMGIYLINNPNVQYSSDEYTLSFQGIDLMSKLTGMRNGNLEGLPTVIPVDTKIRDVVVAIITAAGFNKYIVSIPDKENITPYEIKIDVGGTIYSMLSELRDIYSHYQIYFDVEGVFHFELIPSGQNEPIMIENDLFKRVVTSVSIATDFENVKNEIEVLGRSHDIKYYGTTTTVSGSEYATTISGITALAVDLFIGFTAPSIVSNPMLKINALASYPVVNNDGSFAIIPRANEYYVVRYRELDGRKEFVFMGFQQAYGYAVDNNPKSPFYIHGTTGKIRIVLSGGEYDNIYSNDLANQRARYEIYLHSRMNDSVTLDLVALYWLDVNWVVEYQLPRENIATKWIIKSISTNGETQNVSMIRYYPEFPVI